MTDPSAPSPRPSWPASLAAAAFGAALAIALLVAIAEAYGFAILLLFSIYPLFTAIVAGSALFGALVAFGLARAFRRKLGLIWTASIAAILALSPEVALVLYFVAANSGHDTGPMFG